MEAELNFSRSGDYIIVLSKEEILQLQEDKKISGALIQIKDDERENHSISIRCLKQEFMRDFKKELRIKHIHFSEGPHVIVIRNKDNKRHRIYYIKEDVQEKLIKLLDKERMTFWMENRYCDFTFNKIFLYKEI